MAQIYICASIAMAVVLIVLFAFAPRVIDAFSKPSFSVAGGAVSSLGALLIILIGPYVFGGYVNPTTSLGIFFASSALAGAGGALVMTKAFDSFGQLLPRNGIVQLSFAELLAIATFFVVAGVTVVPIGENGPGIFQSALFVALPFFSGLLASVASRHNTDLHKRSVDRTKLPEAFWRMTIVVGVLTLTESIVEAYANLALPLAAAVDMFPIVLL
ncbi:MAG: hypothetical protein J5804_06850, partial [Eggerthellaceae bacterium]|nr:hypothetical protein [Eggerthellaceae bacterium]